MKLLIFANTDWFMYNFNRSLAQSILDRGHEVVLVSPPGPYGSKLRALGFQWISAPLKRQSLNPVREFIFILWLAKILRTEKIDLIHSFTIKCAVYGSIASRLAGVPAKVNSITGMGYVFTNSGLRARVLASIVKAFFRGTMNGENARLAVLNRDDLEVLTHSKIIDKSIVRLIPGAGVDCANFSPAPSAISPLRFSVLLPARMLWDKGLMEYVEASRLLKQEGRDIAFLLAGAPDSGNPASVSDLKLNSWVAEGLVEWLGHIDDMPELYRSVDAVVLPSYREGLPTGLTEAGACELPLITTDVPGCREVVTDDVDGLLVPVKNSVALARAIARLQDDPLLRQRLGKTARRTVLARFEESIVIDRTIAIYKELIKF